MLYYLNYDGFRCSVFESQVLTPLLHLKKQGRKVRLIDYEKKADLPGLESYRQRCALALGEPPLILPKSKRCNFIISARQIRQLASVLRQAAADSTIVLHGRGCFAGYMALKAREMLQHDPVRIKVITDFRGLVSAEYQLEWERHRLLRGPVAWVAQGVRRIEQYAAEHSDHLLCVSQPFRDYLVRHYPVLQTRISVIPACVDRRKFQFDPAARECLRAVYGLGRSFVVAYNGGAQRWQSPRLLMETFLKIRARIANAKLLLITNEPQRFEEYAAECGLQSADYLIFQVGHQAVAEYLSMADCALLVREPHPVNEVASPTKFAEYLSCNLPVVLSRGIGDTAAVLQTHPVGCFTDQLEKIPELSKGGRWEIFQSAVSRYYSWDAHGSRLNAVYESLLTAENTEEGWDIAYQPALRGIGNDRRL
ncbi:glycosyltransferase involved in cell wall biosynthesis [Hydrogenispora ethanolica]|uniref:Glycosyltransferase involved in cell wall biosynthesis n=1 Tax=Hydrogenispora ethanolica TaxID=1082276 RepID=A0A4R1SBU2_HYDET|nr:glycosyltransferase [Hydrogenispora ethanolica]TCL76754.1 glycosyltransferase involved in cell wall biosynthesis [Hydrogenispora ethanolica]